MTGLIIVFIVGAAIAGICRPRLFRHPAVLLAGAIAFVGWTHNYGSRPVFAALSASATTVSGDATLASYGSVLSAIDRAHSVTASAYTLSSRSGLLQHLESASERGAKVDLALTGDGMGYAVSGNRRLAERERAFHVVLTQEPLHLKAVVVDGGAGGVFVSDRNWTARGSLVLALPARFALPIERAILGDPHSDGPLTTTKGESLAAEAAMLHGATRWIVFESESFGAYNPVYDALYSAAQRGVRVTVLVAQREFYDSAQERDALARLEGVGVHTALSHNDQKIAVVDGRIGWLGSSNATAGVQNQVDWGYTSRDVSFIRALTDAVSEDAR